MKVGKRVVRIVEIGYEKLINFIRDREPRHFIRRSRKLSIRQIVYYLFETSKAAMGLNLSELPRIFPEIGFPSVSRQAVSKARAGIMPELFETLFNDSVETYLNDPSGPSTKWASGTFAILAVDGSKVQLPNHDTIFETFGFILFQEIIRIDSLLQLCYTTRK